MKKILLVLTAALALFLAGRAVFLALVPDDTKIRWLVEDMEEGYNNGSAGRCISPLANDWRHEGSPVDRRTLALGLLRYLNDRDPGTGELRRRVVVDHEGLVIEVDGDTARMTGSAVFSQLRGGEWQETWALDAEAELVDGDDGWEIVRTRHVDVRGSRFGL